MVLIELVEIVVVVLLFAFVLTQLVIPIWRGTALFPSFRWKAHAASKMVAEAREEVAFAQAARMAKNLRKEATELEGGAEIKKE